MKYSVTIEEILKKTVCVDAESLEEAIEKIESEYKACEIVLGADDFSHKTITACPSTEEVVKSDTITGEGDDDVK